jgi:cytochrome c peroxidase
LLSRLGLTASLFFAVLASAADQWTLGLSLDHLMPVPAANPLTREKVELGRALFADQRLSRDGSLACATCHDPHRAFADGRARAQGIGGAAGDRNTPSLVNRGYGSSFFWDGRAATLESQVIEPIQNPKEMASTLESAAGRMGLAPQQIVNALASYLRTIRSGDAPIDQYLRGSGTLTEEQALGFKIFRGRGGCFVCHTGPNFTDEAAHNTGVAWRDRRYLDEGRFAITGKAYHHGAFKTPTLRQVERTAPYMHDGSLKTLEEVVEFCDRGGNPNPHLDSLIQPLQLSAEEKRGLIAFLRTLTGTVRDGL